MASYDEWNRAIISYFVGSSPLGSTIYLSIDDDAIVDIGRLLDLTESTALDDFLRTVRAKTVGSNRVYPRAVKGMNSDTNQPNCGAFLAAMVLAASRMADDEEDEYTQANYFRRFREVLGLPSEAGRPPGLTSGSEDDEPLWRTWMRWLQETGYLPSSTPGEGARTFINYPISQTLLRKADKDRLRRLFSDKHFSPDLDLDTLMVLVRREMPYLRQHIQDLLALSGVRLQAVAESIYEVYESLVGDPQSLDNLVQGQQSRNLVSGLLRIEIPTIDVVEFYLYPRRRRRDIGTSIEVQYNGQTHVLVEDRPGWYTPLGPLPAEAINHGAEYAIVKPEHLEIASLPRRDFWILTSDADNPDSGVYATWGKVQLGIPFILLFRSDLSADLEILRSEKIIGWAGQPRSVFPDGPWLEIHHAMVLAQPKVAPIANLDLWEALKPSAALSIGVSGGLRLPNRGSWLDGHEPQITVFSFEPMADVCIVDSTDESTPVRLATTTNSPFLLQWPGPGIYRLEASVGGEATARRVEIATWESLQTATLKEYVNVELRGFRISGARIEEQELST
jgi:hypothetical protein